MEALFGLLAKFGLGNPATRAVVGGAAGFAGQYFIQPSISYTTVGKTKVARPFALTAGNSKTPSTFFPWFVWPLAFALVFGLFV
jgi:hypothetical protein